MRAYNDWHIDEWCGAYPGRFIPMALPVLWDPELCAEEVRRVAAKGCHSLTFTENPATLGYPSFHGEHWDPLWQALGDDRTRRCRSTSAPPASSSITAPDAPMDVMITLQPMNICQAAADLLWSRVIKEFPDIKIALSEGGTGWIPYFLERIDRTYDMHHLWTGQDFGGKLPSEVFREHFLTCFISDPVGVAAAEQDRHRQHRLGVRLPALRLDLAGRRPRSCQACRQACPTTSINKITYENAMRWYSLRPVRAPGRRSSPRSARCAPRPPVTTSSIKSSDKRRFEKSVGVSIGKLAASATA